MKTINKKKALKLLEAQIAKKGADYIDPKVESGDCMYFKKNGKPSCIIGHVFSDLGIKPEDTDGLGAAIELGSEWGTEIDGFSFTQAAVEVFEKAQNIQDDGLSWGTALESARKV